MGVRYYASLLYYSILLYTYGPAQALAVERAEPGGRELAGARLGAEADLHLRERKNIN